MTSAGGQPATAVTTYTASTMRDIETRPLPLDPEACERARLARDRRFDGRFFVGVVSTGIYCRPVCALAARAARRNVAFFQTAAAASAAGLRPCLRCRPEAAPSSAAWVGTEATVRRALRLIEDGVLAEGGSADLARRLGVGERHLRRLFRQWVGASPTAVARTRRLLFAKQLIDETAMPMGEVALAAGYGSVRRFNEAVRTTWGRTPTELRTSVAGGGRRSGTRHGGAECRERPETLELTLVGRAPYDAQAVLSFLAPRCSPGVEEVRNGSWRRLVRVGGGAGVLEVRPWSAMEPAGEVELQIQLWPLQPALLLDITTRVRRLFDLDVDPSAVAAVFCGDRDVARRLANKPGVRSPGAWDGFELTVRAILGQQVTVKGATTLTKRLVERFGEHHTGVDSEGHLAFLFPVPGALRKAPIERIGLPSTRAEALRRLAAATEDGDVRFDGTQTSDELHEVLTALPGIGDWTAQYVIMRALSDPDAFPSGDLWLRRALVAEGEMSVRDLEQRAEAWRPWRSYAAHLLWSGAAPVETSRRSNARRSSR